MPKPINAPKKNPQRYEIVEPLSYFAFPLSPEQKVGAGLRATSPGIERRQLEVWDDTGKKIPAVPEQEIANFIPPEPRTLEAKAAPFVP